MQPFAYHLREGWRECWTTDSGRIADTGAGGHLPDGVRPAHSTVHRLLRAEGLMSKPTATSDGTDRRRFSYRSAGQLWMSDVMLRIPVKKATHSGNKKPPGSGPNLCQRV